MKPISMFLCIVFFLACNAQKVDLSLRLEPGKTYHQRYQGTSQISQQIEGRELNMTTGIDGTMDFLVKGRTGQDYQMEVSYTTLTLSVHTPQGNVSFSSEKPDSTDMLSTVFKSMLGRPFQVTMNTKGKVLSAKGLDNLWQAVLDSRTDLDASKKAQLMDQLMKSFGEKAFIGNIELATAFFPDHAVSKNDKWEIRTKLESLMSGESVSQYQLTRVEGETVLIKGESKLETEDKEASAPVNGMPIKYNLKGEGHSEIKIDKKSGWIIESKTEQSVKGVAQIKENPRVPDGMIIPMSIHTSATITGN